ncbi:hypothetical protein [Anaerobacillus alkalidiazotrophicus]|uniref:hypothetical protein n=1 Tax=Anaerobacillus alkalidiazotrophicus TaxID=472963 RepID=UPI0014715DFE|nr:hypothetical protein [Anaerobacillus alkalidiazotrophicus]
MKTRHTSEMEKAMQKTHGMGYAEYNLKLENLLKVERKREKDYQKSLALVSGLK